MARRQRGEGAVYQRHDHKSCPALVEVIGTDGKVKKVRPAHTCHGTWTGSVDLPGGDGVRERKRKTIYAQTQAGAIKKLREARKAIDAGNLSTASTTVEEWLTRWLKDVCPGKPRMKPKTLANYRSYVHGYLVPAIGNVRMDRLGVRHVRAVHHYVLDKGLSSTTAGHAHRILGTALADAMLEGLVQRNVVTLVKAPANDKSGRGALTLEQFVAFYRQVDGDRLASRWHAGFFLGIRQGEALGTRWDHLDLDGGVVDVAWQLQRIPYKHGCGERKGEKWPCGRRGADRCPERALDVQRGFEYEQLDGNLCLQRPKTDGSTRLVPLPEPLVVSLRERRALYLAERDAYTVDHGLVWTRPDGRPIDGSADRAAWHDHLKAAGIPDADQHSMRHTTSTLLLALKVPEHVRMSILGHSEAATNRRYTHVDLSLQRQAMALLGNAVMKELGVG